MAYTKIAFSAGVYKDDSPLDTEGFFVDSDKIRFVRGKAQTIGGYERASVSQLVGLCRGVWAWADSARTPYAAFGTHLRLHAMDPDGALFDITPVTQRGELTNPFSVTAASSVVTVAHMAPGEVVVPRALQSPELMQLISEAAAARGVDPARLFVGQGRARVNPATGAEEHAFWDNLGNGISHGFKSIFGVNAANAQEKTSRTTTVAPSSQQAQSPSSPTQSEKDSIKGFIRFVEEGPKNYKKDNLPCEDDGYGNMTCGSSFNMGRTNTPEGQKYAGQVWDRKKVDQEYDKRYAEARDRVHRYVKAPLTPSQEEALTSLSYNLGDAAFRQKKEVDGKSVRSDTGILAKLNSGDFRGRSKRIRSLELCQRQARPWAHKATRSRKTVFYVRPGRSI